MTYKEAFDYATPYMKMVGAFYKNGKDDSDFDSRIKIETILISPIGFQQETYSKWTKNGNNNELSIDGFDKEKDEFDAYLYSKDIITGVTITETLSGYLSKGGFIQSDG